MDTYQVRLEVFEGPLDLLLTLIRRRELEITAVSLAAVTDQYLAYLERLQEIDPGALASFLEVAAQLVLIKSRTLLPRPQPDAHEEDEEDPAEVLAQRLREYAQFKTAAQALRERSERGLRAYVRVAPPPTLPRRVDLGEVSLEDLLAAVREALDEKPMPPLSQVVEPVRVTVEERVTAILRALSRAPRISFRSLLADCASRIEVVMTFLALLELIKQRRVVASQDQLFGEIMVSSNDFSRSKGHKND
jgi:segregation and condensation protein A